MKINARKRNLKKILKIVGLLGNEISLRDLKKKRKITIRYSCLKKYHCLWKETSFGISISWLKEDVARKAFCKKTD